MGWKTKTLGDVADFSQGIQVGLKEQKTTIEPGYVRFIRIVDYTQNTKDIRYIKDPGEKYKVQRDDIVMVRYGSPGLIGQGKKGVIANNLFKIKINDPLLINDYLVRYLSQSHIQKYLSTQGSSTMPALSFGQLRKVKVDFPPIPEQQRIVAILDQAFADIEKARANAERNLKNARELFDSYLNLHLLDVCTQARTKTLDTICELIVDCEHKTAPISGEGYPSIRTPNIGKGHLILNNVRRVSQETYNLWTRRAAPVGGDLILAREAPAGNVGVVPDGELVCLGQRTVLIRPDKANIDPQYLAMFLLHPITQARLLAHSTGATVQHINMKDIRNLAMPIFPEIQSQNVTVKRILKAQALAQSLHDKYVFKLASLDELKKSLLQKAFSGELTKTEGHAA